MDRVTVWPNRGIAPSLLRDLATAFPTSLLVCHPLFRWWQHYEDAHRQWDAQRLFNAISSYYTHGEDLEWRWWMHPTAPVLKDDQFPEPGAWLPRYLARRDLWRRGGATRYLVDLEERERARKAGRKQAAHDLNRAVVADSRRHLQDFARHDPLAGKRRWVHTVPIDLKEAPPDGQNR